MPAGLRRKVFLRSMTRIFRAWGTVENGVGRRPEQGAPRLRSRAFPAGRGLTREGAAQLRSSSVHPLIDEQHFPVLGERPGPVVHQGFCGIDAGSQSGHRGKDVLMAARKRRLQGIQVGYDGIQGVAQLVRQLLQGGGTVGPPGFQRPGERGDGLPVFVAQGGRPSMRMRLWYSSRKISNLDSSSRLEKTPYFSNRATFFSFTRV